MSFDKKYLKYKEKYQKLKNQIGGMFKIGDRVREYDSMVTGVINDIYKISEYDKDLRFQMLGDDGQTYRYNAHHFVLLSSESPALKKRNDDEREQKKLENEQKKAQQIIDARSRHEFFVGDKVRESDSQMTGTVINPNDVTRSGDVLMIGDDGKKYSGNRYKFILLEFEKRLMELEREEAKRLAEEARQQDRLHPHLRAEDTQLAATPVRIPGTNFEPLIKGIFKPNDTQSKFLRLEPSDYSEMKIDIIENNDPLDILSKKNNFLFIRSRSKEGWVKREHVETQVNIEELVKDKSYRHGLEIRQPIKVSAIQALMLRARPSIWSEFTHDVKPGISLELVSDHEKFFKVKTEDGKEGFIKWNNIAEQERLPPHRSLREVTKKARINRTDGQAKFIKLREKPQLTSNFEPVQDLSNGTIVDILEGKNWNIEWNPEWQYVRFSPDRDTDIRGWVRKIYLQYQ